MAIRLGTQNWINPAPFAAAAEMTVEAGRAEGQMYANIGQGINKAVSGYEAKKERERNRQDILNQQGLSNARADRAEARMLKQSKLAASESILAAKKMNLDMASKMYEAMGTPEAEAAMLKAQQDFQEANNWYQVSVGNNAEIEPPQAGVTDYLGVGGSNGVSVGGKPMSQMTDAELDALMSKSGRGEVDYTYRGGATGDMGQGVGNAAPSSRQASMEAAAELVSATDFARAATKKRQQAVDVMATGKTRENRAKADKLKLEAEFLEFEAQRRGQQETAKASAENTRANQAADDARALAREKSEVEAWNAKNPDRPVTSTREIGPMMTTARVNASREDTQQHQKEMAQIRNTYSLGRMAQSEETKKRLIDYAAAHGKSDDPQFKMLNTMRDNAVDSARSLYAAADNDTISKAAATVLMKRADEEMARVKEFDKQMAMLFDGAAAPKTAAPAPAPAAGAAPSTPAPAGESTVDRLKRLWKR